MSKLSSLSKIGEVIAVWLDPKRRETATLRRAIEAGEELMQILRVQGDYKYMPKHRCDKWEVHYQKRWDAWKDGIG